MDSLPTRPMTVEEFRAWIAALPAAAGRFELWDGHVLATHGPPGAPTAEPAAHRATAVALARALREAVRGAGIGAQVMAAGAGGTTPTPTVQLPGARLVTPDVLLHLGPAMPRDASSVPPPLVVCEVLSPTTAAHDLSAKLHGYFALPSIAHYLVADPDGPRLIHHARTAGPVLVTRILADPHVPLLLDPPGLVVDLAEVLGH
jgi:Uma2 family endonuclease